jgi:hypothetical protein
MSSLNNARVLNLDPTWTSSQISAAILDSVRDFYRGQLDIDLGHSEMDKIWVALQNDLTEEELPRVREVSHVTVPMVNLNASIALPPSRVGYFIVFDAVLDLRLIEIFTAPRNLPAWAAAYVRAAWSNEFGAPYWLEPAMARLTSLSGQDRIPDSYSLGAARDFIFAHECGHLILNHLSGGAHRTMHFGGEDILVFDPALKQEIEADAFARELLCRSDDRPLIVQQKGVDWLFGFLGAVLGMRRRVREGWAGDPKMPTIDEGMALRRKLCWGDYNRRRAQSPDEYERMPENVATIDRLRESIDNFNALFPLALADTYAELPGELMELHARVVESPMTEDEVLTFQYDLARLIEEASQRRRATPRRQRYWRLLRGLAKRLF